MATVTTNAATARERLHHFIDDVEDERILAMYTLFSNEIVEEDSEYSEEWKNELDNRYEAYKNGKSTLISSKESKRRIKELLKR